MVNIMIPFNEKDTLKSINVIKVFMMICVVLSHSCAIYTSKNWGGISPSQSNFVLGALSKYLGTFHTQTFVAVSGYLFYLNRYDCKKYRSPKKDILKRAKRLLIPYLFASIVWVVPAYSIIYGFRIKSIVENFVIGISPAQLWFLLMLFIVFVLFYFVSDYIFKLPSFVAILFLLGVTYLSHIISKIGVANIFQVIVVMQNLIFFYLGGLIRKKNIRTKINSLFLFIPQIALFCIIRITENMNSELSYMPYLLSPLASILGIFLVFDLCKYINSDNSVIKKLGQFSMGIYIVHQQIIYIVARLFNAINVNPWILTISTFMLSIIISYFIVYLVSRKKYGSLLMGV